MQGLMINVESPCSVWLFWLVCIFPISVIFTSQTKLTAAITFGLALLQPLKKP